MSRKLRRIFLFVLSGIFVLSLGFPASASQLSESGRDQAVAAPGCRGDSCTGKDPRQMGCVADKRFLFVGDVYYSPSCQAAWAEYDRLDPVTYRMFLTVYHQPQFGGVTKRYWTTIQAGPNWTPMVTWNDSIRSCWSIPEDGRQEPQDHDQTGLPSGSEGLFSCTGWH